MIASFRSLPRRSAASGRLCWAAVLACALGVAISVALFLTLAEFQKSSALNEVRSASLQKVELLRNRIESSMEVLHSIQALCASHAEISRREFHDFVGDALLRHKEIQALSWNPCVSQEQRPAYENQAVRDGVSDFTFSELDAKGELVPAAPRDSYVPVYFLEPEQKNHPALGFDLAANPERKAALERARDSGNPAATGPLRLVQESGEQLGFVVVLPVFRGESDTAEKRRQNLVGFVSAAFRIGDLVHTALGEFAPLYSSISIYDVSTHTVVFSAPGKVKTGAQGGFFGPKKTDWTEPIEIAGLRWKVTLSFLRPQPVQSWAALLAGLVITALTSGYIARGVRHTAEIECRVRERTAELANEIAVREHVEKELRKAERNYRSIFENSIEGIFQSTPDGHYISANPALARIYGYESTEQLIADLSNIERQLYVDPVRRAEFIRTVQANGSVSDFESQVRRKDGRVIWISENARTVRDGSGEVLYYEGTVADITGRKQEYDALEVRVRERTADLGRANEALRAEITERKRAEDAAEAANRAKSEFLAHMSHEIRTPLNAILGYAQILQRDATLHPKQRDAVETIASSGSHLFGLIDEVLDLSKIEAGHMELQPAIFDLHDLIKRLEAMFQHRCRQKRLKLAVDWQCGQPCRIRGDEGKLRQVLINLLGNAVKFTEQGEVRLHVASSQDDLFEFEVADTGIGIPATEQKEIFEPFQQASAGTRKGGTGLGLTISSRYIALMGGELKLESALGIGSKFSFALTLRQAASASLDRESSARMIRLAPGHQVKALVVDDIKQNRDVLAGMLSVLGCETLVAESGEQAIAAAHDKLPDIIFMDIWMEGMNGIEATQHILAGSDRIKIVAHSASAFDHEQKRYLDAGFDDFFAKPFRCERVCECLKNLLRVEFETDEPRAVGKPPLIPLSPEILMRLKTAAELYNVTELKETLRELAELGGAGQSVSDYLTRLMNRYEMESILSYLSEMEQLSAPQPVH